MVPTGTVLPSSTMMRPSVPSAVASTSALTLVDSISTSGSPLTTGSPMVLSHLTTWPSFIPMPHCGRIMLPGIFWWSPFQFGR